MKVKIYSLIANCLFSLKKDSILAHDGRIVNENNERRTHCSLVTRTNAACMKVFFPLRDSAYVLGLGFKSVFPGFKILVDVGLMVLKGIKGEAVFLRRKTGKIR